MTMSSKIEDELNKLPSAADVLAFRTPGPRERVFKATMEHLVLELQERAKEAGIPMLMAFELDTHAAQEGEAIVCNISVAGVKREDGKFDPPRHPGMLVAANALGENPQPMVVALGRVMRQANDREATGGVDDCNCARCVLRRTLGAKAEAEGSEQMQVRPASLWDAPVRPGMVDTSLSDVVGKTDVFDDADPTRVRGPKERIYDAEMAPIINHLSSIAKLRGISTLVVSELDADSEVPGEALLGIIRAGDADIKDAKFLTMCAIGVGDVSQYPPEMLMCVLKARQHLVEKHEEQKAKKSEATPKPSDKRSN